MKSIITRIAPAMVNGNTMNKKTLEQCLQRDEPNTTLRPCLQFPHNLPDLLNWHCESALARLRYIESGRQ